MLQEFKEFIAKGNVMDMAIGVIMGTAFGAIVKSLVSDVIMPPIGLLLGGVDFANLYILLEEGDPGKPYASLADAQAAGAVSINYGVFIDTIISFLIVALVIFIVVRYINQLKRKEEPAPPAEPTTKECPFCLSSIAIKATRCPHCTSELPT
jgi:large conductance mechanosensitive channel